MEIWSLQIAHCSEGKTTHHCFSHNNQCYDNRKSDLRRCAVISMAMRSLAILFDFISSIQKLPAGCGSAISLLQSHECSFSPHLLLGWIYHRCNVPQHFFAAQPTWVSKNRNKDKKRFLVSCLKSSKKRSECRTFYA